ncbi:MAG: peptidoglycan-binding protein [Pelagimonas sp.]|jgi:peptidoglycan hydrolase-like protein with peptidoglycan-binding domain|nr:peptidoglycan-binding protein [Pelagimonas sp.]
MKSTIAAGIIGWGWASGALAAGDALVVGNGQFGRLQTLLGATRVADAAQTLKAHGVAMTLARDADGVDMRDAFARFMGGIAPGDAPVIVILSGVFMHSAQGTYLLPVDEGQDIDAARVLTEGLALDTVLTVLARHPGRALLVLGETSADPRGGTYLKPGIGQLDIPQGVSVAQGPALDVARFVARDLPMGTPLVAAADAHELTVSGYAPTTHVVLRPEDIEAPDAPPVINPEPDHAAWDKAQAGDSQDSYQAYLDRYPDGLHAAAARQRLTAIAADPLYQERRAEEALQLDRAARREIQRDLTILGFDTRGIDGIFGKGTRRAIGLFQKKTGLVATGYLDADQIARLDQIAATRAAELEEEDRLRRAARAQLERATWQQAMADGQESSLRHYLEEFPDGQHADEARALVAQIDARRAKRAAAQDRRAWRRAAERDTSAGYRSYLETWPQGAFADEASMRLKEMDRAVQHDRDVQQAKAQEASLRLNPVARSLAEARLRALGLNPGPTDGKFTVQTRDAIRAFQAERGLRESGFLDEQTVVRLLADGLLGRN